jgi:hypothetical protein
VGILAVVLEAEWITRSGVCKVWLANEMSFTRDMLISLKIIHIFRSVCDTVSEKAFKLLG